MTDPNQLPGSSDDLLKDPEYAKVDKSFTVKELQAVLREKGIAFRAGDSKAELIGRFIDATKDTENPVEVAKVDINTEKPVEAKPKQEKKKAYEQITVYNSGAYNLYEPHSRTLFCAYKETSVELKPGVDKKRIERNISQINATRGKVLQIR